MLSDWQSGGQKNAGASPRKRRHLFSDCLKRLPLLSPSTSLTQDAVQEKRRFETRVDLLYARYRPLWSPFAFSDFTEPAIEKIQKTENCLQNFAIRASYGA